MLQQWVRHALDKGASDLHLEAGLPRALRIDGRLHRVGEPVPGSALERAARELIPSAEWPRFVERRSYDLSQRVGGVPVRVNVFWTYRGIGLAVRLLSGWQPTLGGLNLHPDLAELVRARHGLVLVVGTTGSGKSSTLAALINALDQPPARHVLTLEEPIEYLLRTRHAFVRQREVGRHTPSFEQGLLDALREDPDVLLVGEMRRPETMQLTLDAAETGHLVLASMHAGSAQEALQRLVSSFPPETQGAVRAQVAGSLVGVVAQRLLMDDKAGFRVPECQILRATTPVRALVRDGQMHKLDNVIDLGGGEGQWSWDRYRRWLRTQRPTRPRPGTAPPPVPAGKPPPRPARPSTPQAGEVGVVDLDAGAELEDIIAQLERR